MSKVWNIRLQLGAWVATVPIEHETAKEAHQLALDHLNIIAADGVPGYKDKLQIAAPELLKALIEVSDNLQAASTGRAGHLKNIVDEAIKKATVGQS